MIRRPNDTTARAAANILLDIQAVMIAKDAPFTLTSGRQSPVYIDGRKLISFVNARRAMMQMAADVIAPLDADYIAGGETAGIPYAAFLADALQKPMLYVRKKPKGFGRMAQIEGAFDEGAKTLLVEDLTTDGGSKIAFAKVLRNAGAKITDVFSLFYYDTFDQAEEDFKAAGLDLHFLTSWRYILEEAERRGDIDRGRIEDIRHYLNGGQAEIKSRG